MIAQKLPAASPRRRKGHLDYKCHFDRGAAAVEMALVLPLLLFLLMGMIDFGRAYNAQIQLSAAAREGARLASLNATADPNDANYGNAAITARVGQAAGGLSGVTATPTYCPVPAATSDSAKVVVSVSFTWITGISAMSKFFGSGVFPTPTTLQSTGVMRCAG
ncbi:MAG: TadE/TadG family type IV pilus assembly protein [Dermatophilaceae bacterium]